MLRSMVAPRSVFRLIRAAMVEAEDLEAEGMDRFSQLTVDSCQLSVKS